MSPRDPAGPVLWLARFNPDKGPDLAIEACREAGLPLVLAGKANEMGEERYLDEVIRPILGDGMRLVVNGDRPVPSACCARPAASSCRSAGRSRSEW